MSEWRSHYLAWLEHMIRCDLSINEQSMEYHKESFQMEAQTDE